MSGGSEAVTVVLGRGRGGRGRERVVADAGVREGSLEDAALPSSRTKKEAAHPGTQKREEGRRRPLQRASRRNTALPNPRVGVPTPDPRGATAVLCYQKSLRQPRSLRARRGTRTPVRWCSPRCRSPQAGGGSQHSHPRTNRQTKRGLGRPRNAVRLHVLQHK